MPRKRQEVSTGRWQLFAESFAPETIAGHSVLKYSHAKLTQFIEEVNQLGVERDFHNASKLEATRKRNELIEKGNRLVTAMQLTLKEVLGPDNEQLAGYGIQPFRGRKRAKKKVEAGAPPPETAENSQT